MDHHDVHYGKSINLGQSGEFPQMEIDLIISILRFLPIPSIVSFGFSCKKHYFIATSDELWRNIFVREWREIPNDAEKLARMCGGWFNFFKRMETLDHAQWISVPSNEVWPKPRASHSLNLVNQQVVLFGGGSEGGRHLDDLWFADFSSIYKSNFKNYFLNWKKIKMENSVSGRFQHSCNEINNKILIFGGINDMGSRNCETWISNPIDLFESENATWQLLNFSDFPSERGAHAGCRLSKSRFLMFGGIGPQGVRLGDTWILDMEKEIPTWRKLVTPDSPKARSGHTLTAIGPNRIVMYGGRGSKLEVLGDVWTLDLVENEIESVWTRLTYPSHVSKPFLSPGGRAGHTATAIIGGRVLIIGGEDASRTRKSDVWLLDVNHGLPMNRAVTVSEENQVWEISEPEVEVNFLTNVVPTEANSLEHQVVPNPGSVRNAKAAGRYRTRRNDMSLAKLDGYTSKRCTLWRKLEIQGEFTARSYHAACALSDDIQVIVFGGMVDGNLLGHAASNLVFDDSCYLLKLC